VRAGDLWATPQWLFDRLDSVFSFELDGAADPSNAKCQLYLTDALQEESWPGTGPVFINPPYSILREFLPRIVEESCGRCVVALLPARTETAWFHDVIFRWARELAFIRGRVAFVPPTGVALSRRGNRPVFNSAIANFGAGPTLGLVDLSYRRNSLLLTAGQRELPVFSIDQEPAA